MKILVAAKRVPDPNATIKVRPDGTGIVTDNVKYVVNPFCEIAIEEALRIKEKKGGEVVLVALGPDRVQSALRSGLAMGADSALHLKDPLFESVDTLGTAWALAAAIRPLAADLVLTGQQGVGGDNSQIPGLLAEILDVPQVTMAVKVEIGEGKATVEREIEGAHEVWETSLPAVISAQKGLNEPRYASLKGIMAAKKKTIETKDAASLGLKPEDLAPKTRVVGLELPASRPGVKMIPGDADAQVKELLRLLHEEAKVL